MTKVFVGLGSNLGDRVGHLRRALEAMASIPETKLVRVSSTYDSEPIGDPGEPRYLNAVAELATALSAQRLLWNLQLIESRLGRPRARRSGPRTIDLDILFFGGETIREPDLEVPHPRLLERDFVLVPLGELDPMWVDPRTGQRICDLLRRRRATSPVRWRGFLQP